MSLKPLLVALMTVMILAASLSVLVFRVLNPMVGIGVITTIAVIAAFAGLFGRNVKHKPADDSIAAKEVFDAWVQCWPKNSGGCSADPARS